MKTVLFNNHLTHTERLIYACIVTCPGIGRKALMIDLALSKHAIDKAINQLVNGGYVYTEGGRGYVGGVKYYQT